MRAQIWRYSSSAFAFLEVWISWGADGPLQLGYCFVLPVHTRGPLWGWA